MKAITLYEPWAMLVAIEAKKIETRSWGTWYRGPFAIHAAKTFPEWAKQLIYHPLFHKALSTEAFDIKRDNFPLGMVVAICNLIDCIKIPEEYIPEIINPIICLSLREKAFGDYTSGRFMWMLENVKRVNPPIPAKGKQGLWEWNEKP